MHQIDFGRRDHHQDICYHHSRFRVGAPIRVNHLQGFVRLFPQFIAAHISFKDNKGNLFKQEEVRKIFKGENIRFWWREVNSSDGFVMDPDVRTLQAVIDRKVWKCTLYSSVRCLTCRPTCAQRIPELPSSRSAGPTDGLPRSTTNSNPAAAASQLNTNTVVTMQFPTPSVHNPVHIRPPTLPNKSIPLSPLSPSCGPGAQAPTNADPGFIGLYHPPGMPVPSGSEPRARAPIMPPQNRPPPPPPKDRWPGIAEHSRRM